MIHPFSHDHFMKEALRLAGNAGDEDEIPVGAIVVASNNQIIGKGYNQIERLKDATAHAEMIALTSAFQFMGAKYLPDCKLYVTLEPCAMCAGAIHWAQLSELIYGAKDPKKGFSRYESAKGKNILHESTNVTSGIFAKECGALVTDFFGRIRKA